MYKTLIGRGRDHTRTHPEGNPQISRMPGRPVLRRLEANIAEQGGDAVIFERIAAGEPMAAIARDYGISRTYLYAWIHNGGEEREQAWKKAQEIKAHVLVEDGLDILDGSTPHTSAQASIVKARAEYRRWLAGALNKKAFGEEKAGTQVNVNVGELHLDALRRAGHMELARAAPARELPAEVVTEEDPWDDADGSEE